MLNIRTIILSAVVLVALIFAVTLATARADAVPAPSDHSAELIEDQQSTVQNKAPIPTYRSPLEACFDVPLREVAGCREASQASVGSYRPLRDVCFDVPIGEVAACSLESPNLVASYRSPLDECFDVSISELTSCRNASRALAP